MTIDEARDRVTASVAGEPEDVIDGSRLAPDHQLFPSKARIHPQQDLDPGPAGADLADDAGHFILGAGGRVDVRAPELAASRCRPQNTYSGR
jgi:hypothetical protein